MAAIHNITNDQRTLLNELTTVDTEPGAFEIVGSTEDVVVDWDESRGVASRIRGVLQGPPEPSLLESATHPEDSVNEFLERYGNLFGVGDATRDIKLLRTRKDELGWTHLEFQQLYPVVGAEPIEVYASKIAAHMKEDGTLVEVQSSGWRNIQIESTDLQTRLSLEELRDILAKTASSVPGYQTLKEKMLQQGEADFPIMQQPRLVVYPWQGGFRLAWTMFAYSGTDVEDDVSRQATGAKRLALGQAFVDAVTGELFLFAPLSRDAETPDTGSGLGVTPIGGPFVTRGPLQIVRVDNSSTYLLKDTTRGRNIITYDTANSSSFDGDIERRDALANGTLPVSSDTDGGKNWNRIAPAIPTTAQRTDSQQSEVDLHFYTCECYKWFEAIAGGTRDGWDDNQYPNPPVSPQSVTVIAHAGPGNNAGARLELKNGNWISWLHFFDGDGTAYDFLAGSKFIVAHEYAHAITDFNFSDSSGNPGLTYSGWLSAIHEGMSDVFGGLISEQWTPGADISPSGLIFRNMVYPPDPTAYDSGKFDHFADRNTSNPTGFRYHHGTILAHCTFLMGAGGVHQRASRTPALIPIIGFGRQTVNGLSLLRAARIWYRAYTNYFSTHGTLTGVPSNDQNTFRTLRNACVSAAEDIYGTGSAEHRNTALAFYAVGLHPTNTSYGPDVTFLRWGHSWRLSRPYVPVTSPMWSSRDLFINNGGASEWNAQINVLDAGGNPTQFENTIYCRVRNVGDQAANDVTVQFFYAKAGTGPTSWLPVTDKDGVLQTLNIGTLAAGQSTFNDSAQNSPPASAGVKWYIPPLAPGETVDHFCLKATVTSSNEVNPHNNEVQSNIAYAPYMPGSSFAATFHVGNPTQNPIPVQLDLEHTLPDGWNVQLFGDSPAIQLEPGEERPFKINITMPLGADSQLQPPFDGDVRGSVVGQLSGNFVGTLTETIWNGHNLKGRLTGELIHVGFLVGTFTGQLDTSTGQLEGHADGDFQSNGRNATRVNVSVSLEGCLRPWRRIDISQLVNGNPIGGITVQVQVPAPDGPCTQTLPPTDTRVTAPAISADTEPAASIRDTNDADETRVLFTKLLEQLLQIMRGS